MEGLELSPSQTNGLGELLPSAETSVVNVKVEDDGTTAEVVVGDDGVDADDSDDQLDDSVSDDEELAAKPETAAVAPTATGRSMGDGDVLAVACGTNEAQFHVSRFARGSRGSCILYKDEWITPNEFQYISGRESCKDWKRSIRYQGRPMKQIVTHGLLKVHPVDCSCASVCQSSPGPATIRVKEEKRRRLNPGLTVPIIKPPGLSASVLAQPNGKNESGMVTGGKKKNVTRTWTVAPFSMSRSSVTEGNGHAKSSVRGEGCSTDDEQGRGNTSDPEWSPLGRKRRRPAAPIQYTIPGHENNPQLCSGKRARRELKISARVASKKSSVPFRRGQFADNESPRPGDVMVWSVEQVSAFIIAQGFPYYAHRFVEEEIDGTALLDIREEHLLDRIQMRLGPALRMFRLIRQIQCP